MATDLLAPADDSGRLSLQLGDARPENSADNIAGFGRTLRRAGVRVDSARIALAADAALTVGLGTEQDLSAALEAVMVSREQDRHHVPRIV